MRRLILIGPWQLARLSRCQPYLQSAMPIAHPTMLGGSDGIVPRKRRSWAWSRAYGTRPVHGHHYGWGRGRGHHYGWSTRADTADGING